MFIFPHPLVLALRRLQNLVNVGAVRADVLLDVLRRRTNKNKSNTKLWASHHHHAAYNIYSTTTAWPAGWLADSMIDSCNWFVCVIVIPIQKYGQLSFKVCMEFLRKGGTEPSSTKDFDSRTALNQHRLNVNAYLSLWVCMGGHRNSAKVIPLHTVPYPGVRVRTGEDKLTQSQYPSLPGSGSGQDKQLRWRYSMGG